MKILVLTKDVAGVAGERFTKELLREEAQHAWQLQQSGVFREMYFRADGDSAVLMLECASVDEARAVLRGLPLVREGLIDFDIIPLIAYPGFERLFCRKERA